MLGAQGKARNPASPTPQLSVPSKSPGEFREEKSLWVTKLHD